jgi:hypothetical protein
MSDAAYYQCARLCRRVRSTCEMLQDDGCYLERYEPVPSEEDAFRARDTCFRIRVKRGSRLFDDYGVDEVSVAVPFDAMGNRERDGVDEDSSARTIEIILCKFDGSFCYEHPMVPDVERFENVDDLLAFMDKLAA